MKRILFAMAALPLLHAQPHDAAARGKMFEQYLAHRAAALTQDNLAAITASADWQRRRPQLQNQLRYMLGLDPMPARTPLEPRITGGFKRDGYRVENVVFESMPGFFVTGNLYLPDKPGRSPAVVYVCGHSPGPAGAKVSYQYHGIWYARHGYAAFLLDTIEFGEIPGIHHGTHNLGMWNWLSLGYTPAGPEVWNAMRALDYLETRPEVDAKRVAITGVSGGGAITWYTAAVDERFRVAVPVCATWTAGDQAAEDAVKENCDCIYFPNTYLFDFPTVAALIAPRPLRVLNAMRDEMFPPAGYHDVYRRARAIYGLYGAEEKIDERDHDSGHGDRGPLRGYAREWITKWIDGSSASDRDVERGPEDAQALTVLSGRPSGAVNDAVEKYFIRTPSLRPPASLPAWKKRRVELTAELKDKVFRAFPAVKTPFAAWKQEDKGWTSRYANTWNLEFTTEDGIRVTGRLFVPRGAARPLPALIYVKRAEDIVYPVDHDLILPALGNHVVLELQPRAVDYPVDNFRLATLKRTAAMVGSTVESMQVWDILRSVDYLVEEERFPLSSISIYGRGQMGALGIYAAALDERISKVILDDPPASHWQGPALLNVLRITDLPEAAGLVAPREIVSIGDLPQPYAYTKSVFSLYGAESKLRKANGLSAALLVR